jgi:hypothetical protein
MSNITNTCLYQEYTKITNIPSKGMCLNHVPKHVPNHQSVPYQVSTMHHNLYHKNFINHAPTPVPKCASTMHHNCVKPCINHAHQQCTSTPIPCHVSTMYHTKYINHQHLYHTMYQPCTTPSTSTMHNTKYINHASMSPRNASYIYQKCISNNVPNIQDAPQTMCLNHIPYHS